ncbi:MAG: efflux RND transporter periplasmic adaptor subunit [Lentimicrobiaceae bacterium]|nr:efflux RND transporter periplasmic adaptor subunit [Lentimicrobiaceae bacterium]
MKTNILFAGIIFLAFSCSQPSDKSAELAKLKKEHDKIAEKIKTLEAEISSSKGNVAIGEIKSVAVADIKKITFNHYIEVQGKIDGEDNVAVTPQTAGVVTIIHVKEGQSVKKGQLLAELDNKALLQSLKATKAQYNLINDLFIKQKNLWEKKIGSEVQYLTAKTNKESMEENIKTIEEQIEMTRVKSPINGTIEEIPIKIGQLASPGYPAFRVVNFSRVKVVAEIAEAYAPKVKSGDNVMVYFPDFNKEIPAKINFASRYINPINRTFTVEVRLNGSAIDFKANMITVLKINDYTSKNAIVIPMNLVQKSFDKQFVFMAKEENGKKIAYKQTITPGVNYNGQTEIIGGLTEGTKLITMGYQDLNEGQLVKY